MGGPAIAGVRAEAPVVQWIEQIRPKDKIEVRFLSGAQGKEVLEEDLGKIWTFDKILRIRENVAIHSFLFRTYVTASHSDQ